MGLEAVSTQSFPEPAFIWQALLSGVNLPDYRAGWGLEWGILGEACDLGDYVCFTHPPVFSTLLSAWHLVGTHKYVLNEYMNENCP